MKKNPYKLMHDLLFLQEGIYILPQTFFPFLWVVFYVEALVMKTYELESHNLEPFVFFLSSLSGFLEMCSRGQVYTEDVCGLLL